VPRCENIESRTRAENAIGDGIYCQIWRNSESVRWRLEDVSDEG